MSITLRVFFLFFLHKCNYETDRPKDQQELLKKFSIFQGDRRSLGILLSLPNNCPGNPSTTCVASTLFPGPDPGSTSGKRYDLLDAVTATR